MSRMPAGAATFRKTNRRRARSLRRQEIGTDPARSRALLGPAHPGRDRGTRERRPVPRYSASAPRSSSRAPRSASPCGAGRRRTRPSIASRSAKRRLMVRAAARARCRPQEKRHFGAASRRELDRGSEADDGIQRPAPTRPPPAPAPRPRAGGMPIPGNRPRSTHRARIGLEGECPSAVQRMEEPRVLFAGGARPSGDEEGAIPGHVFGLEEELREHRVGLERVRIGKDDLGERGDIDPSRPLGAVDDRDPLTLERALRLLGRHPDRDPPLHPLRGADRLDASRLPVESARLRCLGRRAERPSRGSRAREIWSPSPSSFRSASRSPRPRVSAKATLGREPGAPGGDEGHVGPVAEDPGLRG